MHGRLWLHYSPPRLLNIILGDNSMTIKSACPDLPALEWVREQEHRLGEFLHERFSFWPRKQTSLTEQLLREVARIDALLPKYHHTEHNGIKTARDLLHTASRAVIKENEPLMSELLTTLRAVNL